MRLRHTLCVRNHLGTPVEVGVVDLAHVTNHSLENIAQEVVVWVLCSFGKRTTSTSTTQKTAETKCFIKNGKRLCQVTAVVTCRSTIETTKTLKRREKSNDSTFGRGQFANRTPKIKNGVSNGSSIPKIQTQYVYEHLRLCTTCRYTPSYIRTNTTRLPNAVSYT